MNYKEITSHEIACKLLGRDPNTMPDVSMRPADQQAALIATAKLWDIAEAINKATDFKADFKDRNQEKWFPVFDGRSGFAFSTSNYVNWAANTRSGSRLCFENEAISDFFGTQFNDLHKEVITFNQ